MTLNDDQVCRSALDAIGNTPLVSLDRITKGFDGRIVAKLEMLNPGFSKKDRAARQIIMEARESGELQPGQVVVELTSGNMGTGLAIVCGILGHPLVAVMSKGNSAERTRMMRALGAEVILVDQLADSIPGEVSGGDLNEVELITRQIVEERSAFRADQFSRSGNSRAHYLGTATEIYAQADGRIDAFCDFAGSAGTFAGCARYFKDQNPDIRCYLVEPDGAEVIAGKEVTQARHPIQGGGYAMPELALLDRSLVDACVAVSADEAIAATRLLALKEGILAGFSSGANLAAALKLLAGPEKGSTLAIIICDSGLKYFSTELFA
jgi:cysteine synthase A